MSEELWKTHCATLQAMLMSGAKQLHEAEMENARLKAEVERHNKARQNDDMATSGKEDPLLIPRHLVV